MLFKKKSSFPPKEENVVEEKPFSELVPKIEDLKEVGELEEINPTGEFLSEKEIEKLKKEQLMLQREKSRREAEIEQAAADANSGFISDFDDNALNTFMHPDSYAYYYGYYKSPYDKE